jgi:hypothetical protein
MAEFVRPNTVRRQPRRTEMTKGRQQRVQQQTLGHRGCEDDPLYGVSELWLVAAEHVDHTGWSRIHAAPARR